MFEIISKRGQTSEKRVTLDIYADVKHIEAKIMKNIGFVRSSHNLADGRTKPEVQAEIYQLLATVYHKPKV